MVTTKQIIYEHHPNDFFISELSFEKMKEFYQEYKIKSWQDAMTLFVNDYNCIMVYKYFVKDNGEHYVYSGGFRFQSLEDRTEFILRWG